MPPSASCAYSTHWWHMWASGLLLVWQRWLVAYSGGEGVCFFLGYVARWDSKTPPQTHLWKGSLQFGNFFSFTTPSPGWVFLPASFVSLFVSYVLSYLLSKRMGCLCVCLVSSARIQKLFCGSCSASKWPFDEFVGVKLGSPSYSSAILGLSPMLNFLRFSFFNISMKAEDFCDLSVSFFFFTFFFEIHNIY